MNVRTCTVFWLVLLWVTISGTAAGQTHEGHSAGMSHTPASTAMPMEVGQSAFAAIAEIVAVLETDPQTDWTTVNIDALRSHLIDMDQLTLFAEVSTEELDGKIIQFDITGSGRALQAIKTMVPTHSRMVSAATEWKIQVTDNPEGVMLTVDTGSAESFARLRALGFFGFMTIGAHHQLHHLQMAKGQGH